MANLSVNRIMTLTTRACAVMAAMALYGTAQAGPFVVRIHQMGSPTLTLDAEPADTFDNIKAKIQDATGISFAKMTLIYNGAAVQDSYTLNDYNIQSGYALNLLTRDRERLIGYMGHLVHMYHHLNVEARQTAKKYPVGSSQWQALRSLSDQASALANRVRVDAELPLLRSSISTASIYTRFLNIRPQMLALEVKALGYDALATSSAFVSLTQSVVSARNLLSLLTLLPSLDESIAGKIQCAAYDNGAEEHYLGHFGVDFVESVARAEAMALCTAMHAGCSVRSCVRLPY